MLSRWTNAGRVMTSLAAGVDIPIMPVVIEIEPTNRCNLHCVFCPRDEHSREYGLMDPELFKRLIDQTSDTTFEYHINHFGEPTLHPDLVEMVAHAAQTNARVNIFTNFTTVREGLPEGLVESGVFQLIMNVPAGDLETYKQTAGRNRFEKALANIERFMAHRRSRGGDGPKLGIVYVPTSKNEDVEAARATLEPLVDSFEVKPTHDWLGVNSITEIRDPVTHKSIFSRCSRLWTTMTVLWDGRLAACCYDYNGERTHGDLTQASAREIWNSSGMRHFRKNNWDHAPCSRCQDPDPQFSWYNLMYRRRAARAR